MSSGLPLEQLENTLERAIENVRQVKKPAKLNQGLWIWIDSIRIQHFSSIRIHKIIESGSNAYRYPYPQQNFGKQICSLQMLQIQI
jgi:hypothetical protein